MSSSTSNSDRRARVKTLLAVVLGLAALAGGLEMTTRWMLYPRSQDFVRFADYPQRAAELCNKPGLRIAFVGNSATQCGVKPEQLVRQLTDLNHQPAHAELFLADGSSLNTWHYMVKQSFWRPHQNPDWLVVNFFNENLQDGAALEIGRLAQFFTGPDDWDELCEFDLPDFSKRAEFVASRHSATFAARDRIKARLLFEIIPEYREFAGELNQKQFQQTKASTTKEARPATHRVLERFLDCAKRNRTNVIFVAFPTQREASTPYPLHADAERLIRASGAHLIDLRRTSELHKDHYLDEIHLTDAGAQIYTRRLVQAVGPLLLPGTRSTHLAATTSDTKSP